jgi:hypothetical protein
MALGDALITLAEVRAYRDVDASFSSDRFAGFLKSVQEINLKQLLGDALWLDFFTNIADAKYVTLLNGENYTYNDETVYYPGLKPFLIWSWLINLPIDGNVHHTQSGEVSYLREVTQMPSKYQINQVLEDYKTNALNERNNIVQYLNTKRATYPLWNTDDEINITTHTIDII